MSLELNLPTRAVERNERRYVFHADARQRFNPSLGLVFFIFRMAMGSFLQTKGCNPSQYTQKPILSVALDYLVWYKATMSLGHGYLQRLLLKELRKLSQPIDTMALMQRCSNDGKVSYAMAQSARRSLRVLAGEKVVVALRDPTGVLYWRIAG